MRKPIIAGNWKMHKTVSEAITFTQELAAKVKGTSVDVVVCPPFTALGSVAEAIKGTNIALAAQNVHWEEKGAFTGEISVAMLQELGCQYVIIGHSERRQYFAETDETVNNKVMAVLKGGLTPIICVGETLSQRENNETENILKTQVTGALQGIEAQAVGNLVIAYEPIWAIGTGKTSSSEDAQKGIAYIRQVIRDLFGDCAESVRIQYGGSVKGQNTYSLLSQKDIDGALVGGASLQSDGFAEIVSEAAKVS